MSVSAYEIIYDLRPKRKIDTRKTSFSLRILTYSSLFRDRIIESLCHHLIIRGPE